MFVDSHCHLNFPAFKDRIGDILHDMQAASVEQALCICTTMEEFPDVHALALQHDTLWASVGVHPDNEGVLEPSLEDLVTRARLPRVVAIGETGLDYFRLGDRSIQDMKWQRERLRVHVRAANSASKPLIIHTRSASDDTVRILAEEGAHRAGGVFHCFTESREVARAALDMGFYISFSGILSFKTAADLREVAQFVPLDRCLIETDSPYLAPVPYRGKVNSPAYIPYVAQALATAKDTRVEDIAHTTSDNFRRLFNIPAPQRA